MHYKMWVFDVSGSLVESEQLGLQDEVFAVHFVGSEGPHAREIDEVTMMVGLQHCAALIFGIRTMAAKVGKTEELEQHINAMRLVDECSGE